MKTPREILLQRHQTVGTKLDCIRQAVVNDLKQRTTGPSTNLLLTIVLKLWRELILPCRATWVGLAAAWIAILLFQLTQVDRAREGVAATRMQLADMLRVFQEKERVLAEVLGPAKTAPPAATPPRGEPLPRSETRSAESAV
jgi:hypothetical protein